MKAFVSTFMFCFFAMTAQAQDHGVGNSLMAVNSLSPQVNSILDSIRNGDNRTEEEQMDLLRQIDTLSLSDRREMVDVLRTRAAENIRILSQAEGRIRGDERLRVYLGRGMLGSVAITAGSSVAAYLSRSALDSRNWRRAALIWAFTAPVLAMTYLVVDSQVEVNKVEAGQLRQNIQRDHQYLTRLSNNLARQERLQQN